MGTVTKDDLQRFMTKLGNRNGKDYLTVPGRVWWFRQEHPNGGIVTTPYEISVEKGYAIFVTSIFNAEGGLLSTATASETARDFADFIEKAGTKSVGRALILAGYGIENAGDDLNEGTRLADMPLPERQPRPIPRPPDDEAPAPAPKQQQAVAAVPLKRAQIAFYNAARAGGFDVEVQTEDGIRPSIGKCADLAELVAEWSEWEMPEGWQESPAAWTKAAELVANYAVARAESGAASG
jgi:hypothetical protein